MPPFVSDICPISKRVICNSSDFCAIQGPVPQTLDDLLKPLKGRASKWAEDLGVNPRTLWRLRTGRVKNPHAGVIALLASGLRVKRDVVKAAIQASYDAAQKG